MDELDLKIIRELGDSSPPRWNIRESYSSLSRKLGVDEETIRLRINKARGHGFLPTWRMMVNPLLLGCEEANLNFEVVNEKGKRDAISKIKEIEGVHSIVDFRGRELVVLLYYENKALLDERVSKIETICKSKKITLWRTPFLKVDLQMKKLDWRIVNAMHMNARREVEEVAKLLRISERSVQRRLSFLEERHAIYLLRPPNVEVVGGLMCNFIVRFSDKEKKKIADNFINSTFKRIGRSDTSPELFSIFGISCSNYAEADKVVQRLNAIDGVLSTSFRIIKEFIVNDDWLGRQIAKRAN